MTVPGSARAVFGERLPLAEAYVQWLTGPGIEQGLLGPREADRVWTRHVLNCAALAAVVPEHARVADVGSGAGLPGIPLLLARPDLTMTLIEPLQRRITFLEDVRDALGLGVQIRRARAEEITDRFDVVVSRAVAPLDRLAGWCAPLLAPGGLLLAIKGSSAPDEVAEHAAALHRLALREPTVVELDDSCGGVTTVVRAAKLAPGRSPASRNEVAL